MKELTPHARGALVICFAPFLTLLLGIPLFPLLLAREAFAGLAWGELLIIVIHILPVIIAWVYLSRRSAGPQ